jgi:mannose-6-phosphate isomerase-like protein (cupin superfamily)
MTTATETTTDVRTLWFVDALAEIKISNRDGDGLLSIIEMDAPYGSMPPLHIHDEDEGFYVLEGRLTVFVGDDVLELEPGMSALGPKDVPHVYRVDSEEGARFLIVTSPGRFEDFVRAASAPAEMPVRPTLDGPPTDEQAEAITRAAAENGITFLGPPGMLPSEL